LSKRTDKIGKVVSFASSEERRFGAQTGRSQSHVTEQTNKLGELQAYRQTYANKSLLTQGASTAHWQDYQNFLQRLDRAVLSQQQIVRDGERNLAVHRQRWLVKRQRLESLQRVLKRYREQDRHYEERLEQKILDDLPRQLNPDLP